MICRSRLDLTLDYSFRLEFDDPRYFNCWDDAGDDDRSCGGSFAGRRMEVDLGKLFIGGISWDTNEDSLRKYFSAFGEVVEAVIMKDRTTGRARGFGFVVFADPAVTERVVTEKHTIDGRMVTACPLPSFFFLPTARRFFATHLMRFNVRNPGSVVRILGGLKLKMILLYRFLRWRRRKLFPGMITNSSIKTAAAVSMDLLSLATRRRSSWEAYRRL